MDQNQFIGTYLTQVTKRQWAALTDFYSVFSTAASLTRLITKLACFLSLLREVIWHTISLSKNIADSLIRRILNQNIIIKAIKSLISLLLKTIWNNCRTKRICGVVVFQIPPWNSIEKFAKVCQLFLHYHISCNISCGTCNESILKFQ